MTLQPLGDQAWMAAFTDEDAAAAFAAAVRDHAPDWLVDVVQAYRSVAIFFDADRVGLNSVEKWLRDRETTPTVAALPASCMHVIPCCYEMQLDLARVAEHTGQSPD